MELKWTRLRETGGGSRCREKLHLVGCSATGRLSQNLVDGSYRWPRTGAPCRLSRPRCRKRPLLVKQPTRRLRHEIGAPQRLPPSSLHSHHPSGKIRHCQEPTRRGSMASKDASRGFHLGRGGIEMPGEGVRSRCVSALEFKRVEDLGSISRM